jgi:hypothetical protein
VIEPGEVVGDQRVLAAKFRESVRHVREFGGQDWWRNSQAGNVGQLARLSHTDGRAARAGCG